VEPATLASLPVFAGTPAARLADVARVAREVHFDAGDRIRSEGEPCDRVAFVVDGEVRVTKAGRSGREIELYRIAAGEPCVLEISSAMGRSPYPARAVASGPGRAVVVPASTLLDLLATDPGVQRGVFGVLSRRLASVMELVEEVAFRRMDERLEALLRREAAAGGGSVHLTHEAVADRLGTAREVVSRLLAQMAHRGEVELHRGEIRLLAPPDGDPGH
jgi:CRP/FNR family transcriptional regulator